MADDPNFYRASQASGFRWPPRPLSVVGFSFDPATGVLDFSGVPGFDLSRVRDIQAVNRITNKASYLYGRPVSTPFSLAEVDGVPVPAPPMSGKVIKVKPDTTGMTADDEVLVLYDPAPAG